MKHPANASPNQAPKSEQIAYSENPTTMLLQRFSGPSPFLPLQKARYYQPSPNPLLNVPLTGRPLQKQNIEQHLENAKQKIAGSWDPAFEDDFSTIRRVVESMLAKARVDRKFLSGDRPEGYMLNTLELIHKNKQPNDDAKAENWSTYIELLKTRNYISAREHNVLLYCQGKKSQKPGTTSLGSLNIEEGAVSGRPVFHSNVQETLSINPSQHRRHIIAWHTIRQFANIVYQQIPDSLLQVLPALIEKLNTLAIYTKAKALVDLLQLQDQKQKTLLEALYIMNSNLTNLWPGNGPENSGINTASMTLQNAMAGWETMPALLASMDKWSTAKTQGTGTLTDKVKQKAFEVAIPILKGHQEQLVPKLSQISAITLNVQYTNADITGFAKRWEYFKTKNINTTDNIPAMQNIIIDDCRSTIERWIIAGLEFDFGYEESVTPELIKRAGIREIIPIMHKAIFEGGAVNTTMMTTVFTTLLDIPQDKYDKNEQTD